MHKFMLGFTALLIAGCAALFSVKGIATLFSGAFISVIVMASSLELGKLIATTFLHYYWEKTAGLLKTYLLLAILLLMAITSMGTFGFLSAAYQNNAAAYQNTTDKIVMTEQQKTSLVDQVDQLQERITTLNETRKQQEKNLATATTTKYKLVYQDVENSNKEIAKTQEKIDELQTQIVLKGEEVGKLQIQASSAGDIGAFKFIAENFNMPVNTVVKWFIIAIVLVFDPLAVALVLSFNTLCMKSKEEDDDYIQNILNRNVSTQSKEEQNVTNNAINSKVKTKEVEISELSENIEDQNTLQPIEQITVTDVQATSLPEPKVDMDLLIKPSSQTLEQPEIEQVENELQQAIDNYYKQFTDVQSNPEHDPVKNLEKAVGDYFKVGSTLRFSTRKN